MHEVLKMVLVAILLAMTVGFTLTLLAESVLALKVLVVFGILTVFSRTFCYKY